MVLTVNCLFAWLQKGKSFEELKKELGEANIPMQLVQQVGLGLLTSSLLLPFKPGYLTHKSETRMTASILKQDPNTLNGKKKAIYYDKTQQEFDQRKSKHIKG